MRAVGGGGGVGDVTDHELLPISVNGFAAYFGSGCELFIGSGKGGHHISHAGLIN